MLFRDLGAQYRMLKPKIDEAVMQTLTSGQFIGGEKVRELEEELADYVGVKHCVTCANGTDALQLALMAWGIGAGDAVFVPDFTFFASGEVVAAVGATPIFVDVDKSSFNIDPEKLEEAICVVKAEVGLNPRVVVAVDLFGLPADYPKIKSLCDTYGLLLLEDGAQGFGGCRGGKMACSFGDISSTSFFPAKPLGCYGDGGAVFTNSDDWAGLMRSYAVHGKGEGKYDNIRVGMNSRLDAMQAAILQVKLDAFRDYELECVDKVASWYDGGLGKLPLILPQRYKGVRSSWAQYTVQLPGDCDRNALQAALNAKGVPTMVYYPRPMREQPAFADAQRVSLACQITDTLCKTVLSLPLGPYMSLDDVAVVVGCIENSLQY